MMKAHTAIRAGGDRKALPVDDVVALAMSYIHTIPLKIEMKMKA
jgi:hypothetical protein